MRVRMRFSKERELKYIGHLDTMRYFQKLMRRADIPIAYSNGMSPHQIMSFALPLGIGDESVGEYADIELTKSVKSTEALNALKAAGVDEICILSFKELPDGAKNAMASVEAADYEIRFKKMPCDDLCERFTAFLSQDEIMILKRTKKSEKMVDLKPFIFSDKTEKDALILRLKCGSVDNTKPELVSEAFFDFLVLPFCERDLMIKRLDLLTVVEGQFVSLDDIGKEI